jgi:hypothetical protein
MCMKLTEPLQRSPKQLAHVSSIWNDVSIQAGVSIQKNAIWNHKQGSWWLWVGYSPTGWMTTEIIYENIGNISTPHLGKHNVKFPVIHFVDGHCTHLTYQLSKLWSGLDSIFISLYSNATRLLQLPKLGWTAAVLQWQGKSLTNCSTRNGSLLSRMVFEPVACIHGMQKQQFSHKCLGGGTTQKCITHTPWQDCNIRNVSRNFGKTTY